MTDVVLTVLNGLSYGLLLFMVTAGLTVVFGMMGILNFAHASFYMVGAYIGFAATSTLGFWYGLIAAPLGVAALGLLVERHLLARVRHLGHAQELLLTFGLAFVINEIIKIIFGQFPVAYTTPDALRFIAFHIGPVGYPFARVFVALVSGSMFLAIFLLLRFTRIGLIVRAAAENPRMVAALGHNVPLVFSALFAFSSALAGLGGAIGGALYSTSPGMADELAIVVFIIVVIGGLGSLLGAFIGALAVGVLTSLAVLSDLTLGDLLARLHVTVPNIPPLDIPFSSTASVVPYLMMLVVLAFSKRTA